MSEKIDLSYRPQTYWPDALDQEQLLSRIQGERRRTIARNILTEEGFVGLNEFLARETLDEEERKYWGGLHPHCMGGEYLPELGLGEVEIARISLASVTSDQISIRALHAGATIRYIVCDEYDTYSELAFTESERPLSLGELIAFIDGGGHEEERQWGGLLVCHWEQMYEWNEELDTCIDFAWVQSAWYPELTAYYLQVAGDWHSRKERESAAEEDDDDQSHQVSVSP